MGRLVKIQNPKSKIQNSLIFVATMWLLSRLVIAAAMLLTAPSLPAAPGNAAATAGWGVFSGWDSVFYEKIATSGYEYAHDGREHLVAFFPCIPLLIRGIDAAGFTCGGGRYNGQQPGFSGCLEHSLPLGRGASWHLCCPLGDCCPGLVSAVAFWHSRLFGRAVFVV